MDLAGTAKLMSSDNYEERFLAEYNQLVFRIRKLDEYINDYKAERLDHTPMSPLRTYQAQLSAMRDYLRALEDRAYYEGIDV